MPVSLVGTFGVMYLLGYSLDNLSLMALTISTGFVVDDAIVVIENVTRYLEQGMRPFDAALKGAREVGSTVFTISVSLVAVFIPLLLMGGIVGRLFREFAVTLSVAIVVSMVISLTATPMMCAYLLKEQPSHGRMYRTSERAFAWVVDTYGRTLSVALRFRAVTLLVLLATIGLNVYLVMRVPKGFFPQQDNGRIQGSLQGDQDMSFQAMDASLRQMVDIIHADPAIDTVNGFTGGGTSNTARLFISLKPLAERKIPADSIIARLRPKLATVPGVTMYLQAGQDLRVGGRQSNAQYQFVMQGDNLADLTAFAPQDRRGAEERAARHRREQRPAEPRTAVADSLRSRDRRTLRHLAAARRRDALRPLRPAAGVHHVHAAQSVPRGDGGVAGVLAEPVVPAPDLRACTRRTGGSAQRLRHVRPDDGAADRDARRDSFRR